MKARILIFALASTCLASAFTTVSYTNYSSTLLAQTDYTLTSFDVTKFDSTLGPLVSITVAVTSNLQGTVDITNQGAGVLTVIAYDSGLSVQQNPSNTLGYSFASNTIPDVVTSPPWISTTIPISQTFTIGLGQNFSIAPQSISSSFFSAYEDVGGIGTVSFQARELPAIGVVGGSYGVDSAGAGANTQFAVTYEYIPEPNAALLGGIGVLALFRRRR